MRIVSKAGSVMINIWIACNIERDIAYLVCEIRLCVLNAAPFEKRRWRFINHHRTVVLTFYPTRQIYLPRLIAHARINIASFFSRWTTIFNISELL